MLAVSAILKRLTAALAAVSLDPYFNNVSLLLTGNGLSGLGNKTFIDSASGLAVSVGAGQPTQGSFNPFNSNYAATFNGSSYLTSIGSQFTMGTGNWTIECWFYDTTGGTALKALGALGSSTSGDIRFGLNAAKPYLDIYQTPGSLTTNTTIAANTWYHMAIVRNGSTTSLYINGTFDSSYTNTSTHTATTLSIGSIGAGSYWTGYISNLRIVKGYALYTSNFTPQAILSNSPLGVPLSAVSLLTLQNGAFVDLSTNNRAISAVGTPKMEMISTSLSSASLTAVNYTPAYDSTLHNSVLFDGSSYITVPYSSLFDFYTGDFTIEFWVYGLSNSNSPYPVVLEIGSHGTTKGMGVFYYPDSTVKVFSGAEYAPLNTPTAPLSSWNHIAVQRFSNNLKIFVNGVGSSNLSFTNSISGNTLVRIGNHTVAPNNNYLYTGNISNLRVVKGAALYTTNFTPSATGLASVSGTGYSTSLLTCQDSTIIDNSSNNLTLSTVGNPTVTTTNPFGVKYSDYKGGFYGGSGYFDGSSYITIPRTASLLPSANTDFTFEAWLYPTATPDATQGAQIFGAGNYGTDSDYQLYLNSSLTLNFYTGGNSTSHTSTKTITLNTWNHVVVSRSGTSANNLTVFINGVGKSFTENTTLVGTGSRVFSIGADYNGDATIYTGYISNLRFINGAGLYTSNFAPPTAPVRPTGNTSLLLNFANAGIYDVTRKNNLIQYGTASVSTSASKFGGGSMYFDGSSYFTSTSGQAFNFGTDDFTVEMWTYPTANTKTYPSFLEIGNHINTSGVVFLQQSSSGGNIPVLYSSAFVAPSSTPALTLNTWNHLAYQRSSGNLRIFVNGIGSSTATFTNNLSDSRPTIGYAPLGGGSPNYNFTGYIDDLRITKGVARYTANFAVPTRELPSSNITLPDGDTYFNNVSLLLNGNGLSGAQNNTFLDSSINNLTVTRNGTVTQGSFSPFSTLGNVYNVGVNGGSGYFNGSSSLDIASTPAYNLGTTFTVEFWFYPTATGAATIAGGTSALQIYYEADKTISLSNNGVANYFKSSNTASLNQWNHVAICRTSTGTNGTTTFVNGIGTTGTAAAAFNADSAIKIGNNPIATQLYTGYISNLRIVKGAALYTSNFTPPTSPVTLTSNGGATPSTAPTAAQTSLLLNFTNGGIVDAVGKNNLVTVGNARIDTATKKYGTGSMYFNGTTDYLVVSDNSNVKLNSTAFTIEAWVYRTADSIKYLQWITGKRSKVTPYTTSYWFGVKADNRLEFFDNTVSVAGGSVSLNTWTHVAVSHTGSSVSLYINGILVAGPNNSVVSDVSTDLEIGNYSIDNPNFTGYIDDLRITKGVARYTSNFTPPTAPLPIQGV